MTQSNDSLNKFLFDLYSIANRVSVDAFRPKVFDLLDDLLKIDSAWWGTGLSGSQKQVVAQASLYKLAPSFLPEYIDLIDQDPLVDIVDAMDGQTLAWSDGGAVGTDAMNAFDRKYGLYFGMTSLQKDPASGVGMFMSLFRQARGPAFSESERVLMQSLVPHLVQAWSINLRLALANESSSQIPDACLIDTQGRVIEISPRFANLLQGEFPDWLGTVVPEPLRRQFIDECSECYRGKSINIWCVKKSGEQIQLLCGLQRASALTPREEAVALAFSRGSSYKEIAIALSLSPGTVRSYLSQCYAKLDVKNKVELGNALDRTIRAVS